MPRDTAEKLWDIEAIKQVKAKYCYYVDGWFEDPSNLERLMNEVFTHDSQLDFGAFGTGSGRAEVEAFFTGVAFKLLAFSQHLVHSPLIELQGDDRATGQWHFLVPCTLREGNVAAWIGGTYHERYVKRDGAWFIHAIHAKFHFLSPFDRGWAEVPNLLAAPAE